ncbi:MAG: GIY-YIG nuclease family protein, partial [Caldithrix sp.]|nr:GIY-YIG nuclease family protein [Caldithrix sp.]
YYTYILTSLKYQGYYYGSTFDLQTRIKTHNAGKVKSTKSRRPLKRHNYETFQTKRDAIQRERFFKSTGGYTWLKNQAII